MKELVEKLTSYNIFNYLVPGTLFALVASKVTRYNLIQQDIVVGAFLYYFLGLVISRLGSLVLEPIAKRTEFVRYCKYNDFVAGSKKDPMVAVLSETNNMYRTLTMVFAVVLLLKAYEKLEAQWATIAQWRGIALYVALLVMFLFAWKKQSAYVTKRVSANIAADAADEPGQGAAEAAAKG